MVLDDILSVVSLSKLLISWLLPSRICDTTPDWHVVPVLNLLSLTMGTSSNASSNKFVRIQHERKTDHKSQHLRKYN
jgi:hypothetical protein